MKSFSAQGIVLKRVDVGELDRVVTIFTREEGKLVCVAKGARKLTSSKLAALEPGSLIKASFAPTKSLPILKEATLLEAFVPLREDLPALRSLFQVLEMLDAVLAEGDVQLLVYDLALQLMLEMSEADANKTFLVRRAFAHMLSILGFTEEVSDLTQSIQGVVEDLTQRKMRAFAYLSQSS